MIEYVYKICNIENSDYVQPFIRALSSSTFLHKFQGTEL